MTRSKNKFMIGVNDLIAEIKDNSSIIFANSTSVFFSCFGRENDDHLRILIPDYYNFYSISSSLKAVSLSMKIMLFSVLSSSSVFTSNSSYNFSPGRSPKYVK